MVSADAPSARALIDEWPDQDFSARRSMRTATRPSLDAGSRRRNHGSRSRRAHESSKAYSLDGQHKPASERPYRSVQQAKNPRKLLVISRNSKILNATGPAFFNGKSTAAVAPRVFSRFRDATLLCFVQKWFHPAEGGWPSDKAKRVEAAQSGGSAAEAEGQALARAPVESRPRHHPAQIAVRGHALPHTATAGALTIRNSRAGPRQYLLHRLHTRRREAGHKAADDVPCLNRGQGSPTLSRMAEPTQVHVDTGDPEYVSQTSSPVFVRPQCPERLSTRPTSCSSTPRARHFAPALRFEPSKFSGMDQDVDAFASAIIRYATKYRRRTPEIPVRRGLRHLAVRARSPMSSRTAAWRSTASCCCPRS